MSASLSFEALGHTTLSLSPISLAEAEARVEALRQQLNEASYAYYVLAAPILPDQEYDRLYQELLELEDRHPQVVRPDSPTQRVGEPVEAGLPSVTHGIPLLSLDNVFAVEELPKWEQRLRRHLDGSPDQPLAYACELKVDGVALALRYEQGLLVQGATRGDGHRGEEITTSVRTIRSIPLRLRCTDPPAWAEIRGEAFLAESTFSAINQQRRRQEEVPFANARNACAGTLRQLDPQVVASRKVDFVAYGLHLSPEQPQPRQQLAALDWLSAAGFKIDPHARHCTGLADVGQFYRHWNLQRHHLPYGTDGVVVKLNALALQQQVGHTRRAPRWAVAMKFSQMEARSTLRRLVAQVGRTGVVTPVAEFDPVELDGSTVARATLHNAGWAAALTGDGLLRVGDAMVVRKAGGVIPEVVRVEPCSPPGEPLAFPRHCPECGSPLVRLLVRESRESQELEAATRCVNSSCPAILRGALRHWASRDALDIDGLGPERIEQLVERDLVHTMDDLYGLQEAGLTALEGWAASSARRLLQSLESSKQQPWHRVLYGLGIPHVGTANAKVLARAFPAAEGLAEAFSADRTFRIDHLEGIDSEIAGSLQKWLSQPGNRKLLTELESSRQSWDHVLSHLPVLPLSPAKVKVLASAFPSAQQLAEAFSADRTFIVDHLESMSPKTVTALRKWLSQPGSHTVLMELEASRQPWDHALSRFPVLPLSPAKAKVLASAFPSAQQLAEAFSSDRTFIIDRLEGMSSKTATALHKWLSQPGNRNLLAELEASRQPWDHVLSHLSVLPLSPAKAKVLARVFPSAQQLAEAFSVDRQLMIDDLKGIGPKTATALQKWLSQPANRKVLTELDASRQPWDHALSELPVLPLGSAKGKELASAFPSAQQLAKGILSDMKFIIDDLEGIDSETAAALQKWLSQPGNRNVLTELEASRQPWDHVLSHLPVLPLGSAKGKELASAFPSAQQLAKEFPLDMKFVIDDLEGIGPKTAAALQKWLSQPGNRNVLTELEASRQPWDHVLSELPVLSLGSAKGKELASAFPSAQQLAKEFPLDMKFIIADLEGIDSEIASSLQKWLAHPANQKLLAGLTRAGLRLRGEPSGPAPGPLTGQTFVLTGTLPSLRRAEAQKRIEAAGGTVSNSVTRKTTRLVVGANPSSKLDKARALGVEILDEAQLLQCLASPQVLQEFSALPKQRQLGDDLPLLRQINQDSAC